MIYYLGYALLALLSLVSLVCFIRSYRNIRDGKISRRLIDIGIAAITLFGAGVVLAFTSVTTMALLDGSFALKLGLAGVGALGLVLLIIAKPADRIYGSTKLMQRRMERRIVKQESKAEQHAGVKIFDQAQS